MTYQIFPFGEVWQNGIFNVPKMVAERYIKMASEYQIKALLILLSMNGRCENEDISKKLGITVSDVKDREKTESRLKKSDKLIATGHFRRQTAKRLKRS